MNDNANQGAFTHIRPPKDRLYRQEPECVYSMQRRGLFTLLVVAVLAGTLVYGYLQFRRAEDDACEASIKAFLNRVTATNTIFLTSQPRVGESRMLSSNELSLLFTIAYGSLDCGRYDENRVPIDRRGKHIRVRIVSTSSGIYLERDSPKENMARAPVRPN